VHRYSIPFNRPWVSGKESTYIAEAMAGGRLSGDGRFTEACHQLLQETLGASKVLLTTSGTHALEMSALLLNLGPGDEVILPSFTFVSTANAFLLRGAKPVFADIRPDTLNLDEASLEGLISANTRAIVPVHYGGVACRMDKIGDIAAKHGLAVVEDNAHGIFGKFRGKYLGTWGDLGALSFHESKNFSCGEGGAILINRADLVARAEVIREKGTNRSQFFRNEIDKYSWVDRGSSYLPSELLAAFLYAQLEEREAVRNKRERIWRYYRDQLKDWAESREIGLPQVPPDCEQSFHMFYLLMPDVESRRSLIGHLQERGILSVFHYLPLHLSEMGRRLGGKAGDCPVTEDLSERLLRLPFFNDMTEAMQSLVVTAVRNFEV
jgi:dTDP-4-amino-4,6-dideoxygalactose transaminase